MKPKTEITLRDLMAKVPEDKTVFIGAISGYMFIGNLERFKMDFPNIDEDFKKINKKLVNAINSKIEKINKRIDVCNENKAGHGIRAVNSTLKEIEKSLYERKVLDIYEKLLKGDEGGLSVIIEGNEAGKYWLKAEYDSGEVNDDEEENDSQDSQEE